MDKFDIKTDDMHPAYIKIDTANWIRKTSYHYFSNFVNPTYGFNVTCDITKVYQYSKKTKTSVFINMLYLLVLSLNEIPSFRIRIVNGEIIQYESIYPSFTVMTDLGQFENAYCDFYSDYQKFYKSASLVIEKIKKTGVIKDTYNDSKLLNTYFITCIPWLSFNSMTHPIPDKDVSSLSVPRICWDKFIIDDKTKKVTTNLNITVSHALMDGKHLCDGFNNFQDKLNNIEKYLN